jgi:hypothetical protein
MNISRFVRGLALALLFLPFAAFADSIDVLINTGGTLTYNPVTQTLTLNSTITELINQYGQIQQGDFGPLTITTGPLISGSIDHHAFFGPGTSEVNFLVWYQVPNSDEFHLAGGGGVIVKNFDQLVVANGTNQFTVLSGRTGFAPEPSTVSMLATGLALFSGAGVARVQKRWRAKEPASRR